MVGRSTGWRALRWAAAALLCVNVVGALLYATAVSGWGEPAGSGLAGELLLSATYGAVGLVIVLKRPQVPIGWLFLVSGALWSCGAWAIWAHHIVATGGHPSGFAAFLADGQWLGWPLVVVPAVQLPLLLLPDGRLRSPRLRPAAVAAVVAMVVASLALSLTPGPVDGFPQLHHPGIASLKLELAVLVIGSAVVLFAVAVVGFVSLVREYRRARDVERQQLRWLAAGGCGAILSLSTGAFTPQTGWATVASGVGFCLIPVSVGVAVLRYRLYDLGRLVGRTVSYLLITGILVGVYAAIVTLCGLVASGSAISVAAGTLVAVALFRPLRRYVQLIVDHRFNRARYDAARTVDAFNIRLRDTVSTDSVTRDLIDVTMRTLEPATVSVWLRP